MVGIRLFPIGEAYFQGRTVSFREGKSMLFVFCFPPRGFPHVGRCEAQAHLWFENRQFGRARRILLKDEHH